MTRTTLAARAIALCTLIAAASCSSGNNNTTHCTAGCNGQILTSCDTGATVTTDCSTLTDSQGNKSQCEFIADQNYYDCVADFSPGCGTVTAAGSCAGAVLSYCLSSDSGDATIDGETPVTVQTIDCSTNTDGTTACIVGPDGIANCDKPGTTGCGSVPAQGACTGTVFTSCVSSNIVTVDCAASASSCGLTDTGNNGCVPNAIFSEPDAGAPPAAVAVTGSFVYEKKTVDTSTFETAAMGFAATPVLTPVRRALVQLIAADGTEIQRAFTAEDGSFTLALSSATAVASVAVSTSSDPTLAPINVRDCPPSNTDTYPAGCTDQIGSVYQFKTARFTGPMALGQTTITIANDNAGAFNIFNLMLKGADFARTNFNNGANPGIPPLLVEWKQHFRTTTSYFSQSLGMIVVQGVDEDTDEFDDPVLMHEFGHFLQASFSQNDSPGGMHDGSPTDPRTALGEGYGTYVGCRIAGSSIYFDTGASGISVTDINNTGFPPASLTDPLGIKQLMSEFVDGEILWRLDLGTGGNSTGVGATNAQGSAATFDVLGKYFVHNGKYNDDHGVSGRDLVKFLDGYFCRNYMGNAAAVTPIMTKLVMTDHGFPYDDFAHTISPIGSCP